MRKDVKESLIRWTDAAEGPEIILNQVGDIINENNPEGRTEMMTWTIAHKEGLLDSDKESLINPLINCL